YKVRDPSNYEEAGHAVASTSTPLSPVKDPARFITRAAASSALGFTVNAVAVTDVVRRGGLWYFFFYATDGTVTIPQTLWVMAYATSSSLSTPPTIQGALAGLPAAAGKVVILQSIFKQPNSNYYTGLFVERLINIDGSPQNRGEIYAATSVDLVTWARQEGQPVFVPAGEGSAWNARLRHHAAVLKDPADPDNARPLMTGGEYRFYVSGIDSAGLHSQANEVFVTPGGGRDSGRRTLPADGSSQPAMLFRNTKGASADGGLSLFDTPDAVTRTVLGLNLKVADDGNYYRDDPSKPYAAIIMRQDQQSLTFTTTDSGGGNAYPPLVVDANGVSVRGFSGTAAGAGTNAPRLSLVRSSDGSGVALSMDNSSDGLDVRDALTQNPIIHARPTNSTNSPSFGVGTNRVNLGANGQASIATVGGNTLGALELEGSQNSDGNAVGNISFFNTYGDATHLLGRITAYRSGADYNGRLSCFTFPSGDPTSPVEHLRMENGVVTLPKGVLRLDETTAPASPPSGCTYLYMDSADGKVKLKKSDGTVIELD
ncbi:MAG: hypothetical protein M3348_09690, partial [Acidobacteriota bacterium]|nr:hypothetical protein [Acidobacteriota bacterium]